MPVQQATPPMKQVDPKPKAFRMMALVPDSAGPFVDTALVLMFGDEFHVKYVGRFKMAPSKPWEPKPPAVWRRLIEEGIAEDKPGNGFGSRLERAPLCSKEEDEVRRWANYAGGRNMKALDTRLSKPNATDAGFDGKVTKFEALCELENMRNRFYEPPYHTEEGKEGAQELEGVTGSLVKLNRLRTRRVLSASQVSNRRYTLEVRLDPDKGVSLGTEAYRKDDLNPEASQLHNSDLLFMTWKIVAGERAIKNMKQYWSYAVKNKLTCVLIEACLSLRRGMTDPVSFVRGSPQLQQLVRTPVGRRVPPFLQDFAQHLGLKEIAKVTVPWSPFAEAWMLIWDLVSREAEPGAPTSSKGKGRGGKKSRSGR